MKKLILILVVALTQHVFGQDSIYKINGEIISSKIEEVNPTQIKFRKTNNLNGPMYSELKNDVYRIKFANGVIDTITKNPGVKEEVIVQSTNVPINNSSPRRSIMYKNIGDRDLFYIIQELPASDTKNKMLREYSNMISYKRTQYLANGLGFGIGFAIPVAVTYGALIGYNSYNYGATSYDPTTVIVIGALAGAAIRITGQVLTKMYKNKKLHARKNVMMLYDQLN